MKMSTLVEETKMPMQLSIDRAYVMFTEKLRSKSLTVAEKKMKEGKKLSNVKQNLVERMSGYLKTSLRKIKWGKSTDRR